MTVATLKRTEKKNALNQIKPVNKLDDLQDLTVEDSDMPELLSEYENALEPNFRKTYGYIGWHFIIKGQRNNLISFKNPSKIVLSPEEITLFVKMTTKYKDHENYPINTGRFISDLIQNSYDAGHNKFYFETNKVGFLSSLVEGNKKNPIIINIEQNYWGWDGSFAEHSTFNIKENHGAATGRFAKHSTFNIEKNYGEAVAGTSEHSTFNIKENSGELVGIHAENCIFKSPNKETLDSIKAPENNKFYLIQPNGEEIPYRK